MGAGRPDGAHISHSTPSHSRGDYGQHGGVWGVCPLPPAVFAQSKYRAPGQGPGISPIGPGSDPAVVRDRAADRWPPPGTARYGKRTAPAVGLESPDGTPGAVSTTRTLMRSFFSWPSQDLRRDWPEKTAHCVNGIAKLKHPINRGIVCAGGPRRVVVRSPGRGSRGSHGRPPGPVRSSVRPGRIGRFRRARGHKLAKRSRGFPEIDGEAPCGAGSRAADRCDDVTRDPRPPEFGSSFP
jgi:hypothetical protein